MELLLLKSSVCLLVLLLFYKIALEPLSVHKFKRVYLLVAVAIAAIIPFITFVKYVQPNFDNSSLIFDTSPTIPLNTNFKIVEETNYLFIILWSIYALGVGLFFIRFCINLFQIISKIKKHTKVKSKSFINVLMEQIEVPHTFFNFIFLNKNKFENNQIPREVLLHEQTHAKQKHSLDIMFIELLQVVFWFNPLVYWLKKEVKLNHEFLADQNVIKQGVDTKTYQNILLQFSSNQQELALVNAINYSSIKKRFTLMKTQTPERTKWIRSVLLLPLLALLLYSFSSTKEVEKEVIPKMVFPEKNQKNNSIKTDSLKANYSTTPILEINQNPFELKLNGKATNFKDLKEDLGTITGNNKTDLEINSNGNAIDIELIKNLSEVLKPIVKNIVLIDGIKITDNQKFIKTDKNSGFITQNPTLKINGIACDGCTLNLSKKGIAELILSTTNQEDITNFKLKIPGIKTLFNEGNMPNNETKQYVLKTKKGDIIQLFDIKTKSNKFKPVIIKVVDKNDENYSESPKVKKGDASSIPPPPPPPPVNPNATPEEREKQERVIKKYYKENKIIKGKVYKNPPPPPAPLNSDTETGFININDEAYFFVTTKNKTKYYNKSGIEVDKNGNKLSTIPTDGSKVIPGQKITKVYKDGKVFIKFKKTWKDDDLTLPPPPPPMKTTDHIISMAKKDASFYYNGEAITSDKALDLVKNNSELNISSHTNNDVSTVHLSEKPIKTVNGKVVNE
ncbi:M56 family metallopeptidase [Olleya marilimosa]|uniref:M56 family metallopeptidase n=1 Tax=Olleya marilimosa TaxID=272164 RepID=A0ABR8LV63_9FLAO|nr:M56 family metallopeptidase [Olleya marilimosa]MBD3864073.1 M56 family metallopeptidase [Olleya marilimosa]